MPASGLHSMGVTYPAGFVIEPHRHDTGQLIYAIAGTMQVVAGRTLWLVPPSRALWAPAGVVHTIEMRSQVAMRTIYVPPALSPDLPAVSHAIEVAPLLRELILHIVDLDPLSTDNPAHGRLTGVFLDLVAEAERLPLLLPIPPDERAARVSRMLRDDPARDDGIDTLAQAAGTSVRTLQRAFQQGTGMRFVEWRQRLRLLHAITLLEQGASVTDAGAAAGYASSSAFVAAFRSQIGETPRRFARSRRS